MPQTRKPSVLFILGRIIAEDTWNVLLAILAAGFGTSRSLGETMQIIELFPAWVYWAFAILFLVRVILNGVKIYKEELEKINNAPVTQTKVAAEKGNALATGDIHAPITQNFTDSHNTIGSIKDSFNNQDVPPNFYKPPRENLKHSIGIAVQEFGDKFRHIHLVSKEDKYKRYDEAREFLETKMTELFRQANLILADTDIPRLMSEIHSYFAQYWSQMEILSARNEERTNYINIRKKVPPEIISDIDKYEKKISESITMINFLVESLIERTSGRDLPRARQWQG